MLADLETIYDRLYAYSEARGFAGHDPFDGLNSRVFQTFGLARYRTTRLAWLQMIKRSPVDLRQLVQVPDGVNPKGLALFALAELSRLRSTGDTQHAENAGELIEQLTGSAVEGRSPDRARTMAYGYNFDWQSRMFFAPKGTPAVVPTAFACRAFTEAYQAFRDDSLLNQADDLCRFFVTGLRRPVDTADEVCFSYTPLDNGVVYNASLLGGDCLASVGQLMRNEEYLSFAARSARFVVARQRPDGAWDYGEAPKQRWVDNFHTAFVLVSLHRIAAAVPAIAEDITVSVRKGIDYWLSNFFLDDGTPRYYDTETYPVDIHSAAAAIVAMSELSGRDKRLLPMAHKVAQWTAANMLAPDGSFYYQIRRRRVVKTPFMRWGQAWMAFAIARLLEAEAADRS
jgi:hypothetical protein